MTIKEARKILVYDIDEYTDDEVQEIIDWLNMMADLSIDAIENNHL
jgi:hypothetical protein